MKNLLLISLFLSFLFSCAGPDQKAQQRPGYSQDTENEFESIENDRKKVLEYYRRLRQQDWDNYKKKGKRLMPRKSAPRRPRPSIAKPKRTPPPPKPPLSAPAVEEMKIEMRQYMSYFCMENRKSNRFSDANDCDAFTQNALNTCEQKYPVIRDRKIIKCLQARLR